MLHPNIFCVYPSLKDCLWMTKQHPTPSSGEGWESKNIWYSMFLGKLKCDSGIVICFGSINGLFYLAYYV